MELLQRREIVRDGALISHREKLLSSRDQHLLILSGRKADVLSKFQSDNPDRVITRAGDMADLEFVQGMLGDMQFDGRLDGLILDDGISWKANADQSLGEGCRKVQQVDVSSSSPNQQDQLVGPSLGNVAALLNMTDVSSIRAAKVMATAMMSGKDQISEMLRFSSSILLVDSVSVPLCLSLKIPESMVTATLLPSPFPSLSRCLRVRLNNLFKLGDSSQQRRLRLHSCGLILKKFPDAVHKHSLLAAQDPDGVAEGVDSVVTAATHF
ncbi:hypothetical protein FOPE_10643 [Fonsecaea pedrosoi]|nr:hypothetical protein FOPE_10643 [Fonsecaea pedrosoi]